MATESTPPASGEATLAGGSYEVIRARLLSQAEELGAKADGPQRAAQEALRRHRAHRHRQRARPHREQLRPARHRRRREVPALRLQRLHRPEEGDGRRGRLLAAQVREDRRGLRLLRGAVRRGRRVPGGSALRQGLRRALQVLQGRAAAAARAATRRGCSPSSRRASPSATSRSSASRSTSEGNATYIDNRGERDHVFPAVPRLRVDGGHARGLRARPAPARQRPRRGVRRDGGGDLTVKVENNTADGQGIYREPVDDPDQSLDDAEIAYAQVGAPHPAAGAAVPRAEVPLPGLQHPHPARGAHRRHRQACVQPARGPGHRLPRRLLPADGRLQGLRRASARASSSSAPSARPTARTSSTSSTAATRAPTSSSRTTSSARRCRTRCSATAIASSPTGAWWCSAPTSDEPTRVHPMQVWQTPFVSAEHAAKHAARARLPGQGRQRRAGARHLRRADARAHGRARTSPPGAPTRTSSPPPPACSTPTTGSGTRRRSLQERRSRRCGAPPS